MRAEELAQDLVRDVAADCEVKVVDESVIN